MPIIGRSCHVRGNNAMIDFKGTILFASHDHELTQSVANRIIEITPNSNYDKLMTYQAAWAFDENKDISTLSAMAKLQSCRAFREIAATTIQIFGGMGFTIEADPQLFFRRAKHLQNYLWDESYLEQQLENNFFN